MRGAGIDMDLLRRCIASCCTAGTHGGGAVREPGLVANAGTVAHAPAAAGLDRAEIRELKRIVAELGVDRELKQSTLIATRTAETAVVIDNSVDNNIQPPATMGYYPKRTKKGKGGAAKKGKGGAAKKGKGGAAKKGR